MAEEKQPDTIMLYKRRKDGVKNEHAWNLPLETKIVEDGEIDAHKAKGWLTAAEVHASTDDDAKADPKKPAA